jgi:hypothetical protein
MSVRLTACQNLRNAARVRRAPETRLAADPVVDLDLDQKAAAGAPHGRPKSGAIAAC